MATATPVTALAPPPATTYQQAVEAAYSIVINAAPGDTVAARQAISVLVDGTGGTQPEIIIDLEKQPPDFFDAGVRLRALLDALGAPASTADPATAHQKLHDVLTMHRYDALHQPPSLLDRLGQWVNDRLNDLLRLLFGRRGGGLGVPDVFFYTVGIVALIVVAIIVFRSTRGRFSEDARAAAPPGPRAPADFFAEADRLAAAGDRVRAIRALCAGVAATLAGERTWEGSPLTVREIFSGSPNPAGLRPLLLPFEAAVYGGRDVDEATYQRAAAAAAPFRPPLEAAA